MRVSNMDLEVDVDTEMMVAVFIINIFKNPVWNFETHWL